MSRLFAAILFLLAPNLGYAEQWNSHPASLVKAFQADYLAWNNHAVARERTHGTIESLEFAEREYVRLLAKYCLPGFKGEPVAFGDQASHDPAREVTISSSVKGTAAVIRTELRGRPSRYVPVFEYEMEFREGRWFLMQVYLIDGTERLPGL